MNIAKRFNVETIHHQMTVLHDHGLYKHLRFLPVHPDPKQRTNSMWFDLITWPHNLVIRGDYGDTHAFSRVEDMLGFFRESAWKREPNLHYWAEKLTSNRDSVHCYNEQIMRDHIRDAVNDEIRTEGTINRPGLREAVQRNVLDELCGDEQSDRTVVANFEYYQNPDDQYAYPSKQPDFDFDASWEWKLSDYDWSFVWACHAVLWGTEYYHLGRRPEPLPEPKPVELDAGPETEPALTGARGITTVHLPGDEPKESQ